MAGIRFWEKAQFWPAAEKAASTRYDVSPWKCAQTTSRPVGGVTRGPVGATQPGWQGSLGSVLCLTPIPPQLEHIQQNDEMDVNLAGYGSASAE